MRIPLLESNIMLILILRMYTGYIYINNYYFENKIISN